MKMLLAHMVDRSDQYGGVEKVLLLLAAELQKRPDIELAVAINPSDISGRLRLQGVRIFDLPQKRAVALPSLYGAVLNLHRQFSPQIVHSHHRFTTFLFQSVPARRYRLVHTFHVEQFTRKWYRCFGDAATAVSQGCKEHFVRHFGLSDAFITVVYDGVAAPPKALADSLPGRTSGAKRISVIARLTEQKGHAVLLKALSLLPAATLRDLKVTFVGDGEKRTELEVQARRMGLERTVVFASHQEDVFPFIAASDFTVLPSLWEGFGLSIVESMLCGRPVIGSSVGGIPELIADGRTGLLVAPGDATSLAGAVERLLEEPETVERMGEVARSAAQSRFTVPAMIDGYLKVYHALLEGTA